MADRAPTPDEARQSTKPISDGIASATPTSTSQATSAKKPKTTERVIESSSNATTEMEVKPASIMAHNPSAHGASSVAPAPGDSSPTTNRTSPIRVASASTSTSTNPPDQQAPTTDPIATSSRAASVKIKKMGPTTAKDWVLHAVVVARSPVRNWQNLRGGGTLQEVFLMDGNGDFIRATVFNDAVNKFADVTTPGSTCSLAGGKIKYSFTGPNSSARECSVSFSDNADIHAIVDEELASTVPSVAFTRFSELTQLPAKASVNIIGILVQATSTKRVVSAQGKNLQKRELILTDDSNARVLCTVWGNVARDELEDAEGKPILIKGGQIDDYMGTRSVAAGIGCSFMVNPVLARALTLSMWYETGVDHASFPIIASP